PFALGLGIDAFVASQRILGTPLALPAGLGATAFALVAWYGLEWLVRARNRAPGGFQPASRPAVVVAAQSRRPAHHHTPLATKIKQVLMEARTVLPGAQALLGFQFTAILTDAFEELPPSSQLIHLISLGLI